MKVSLKVDQDLLQQCKGYLISIGEPESLSNEQIIERSLSLLVYGKTNKDVGKAFLRQYLESMGASMKDFHKGRIQTWARISAGMRDDQPRERTTLESAVQEAIKEQSQKDAQPFQPTQEIIRSEPEEVSPPKYSSEEPPWERCKLVPWETVENAYAREQKNALTKWAKDDELKRVATRAALAHIPPAEYRSPEALRLSKHLYELFKKWKEETE